MPDETGKSRTQAEFGGKFLVIYFYPKDDTPGCTREACAYRDAVEELRKLNATVVGVSKDGASSHQKFKEKHGLNFPLLVDANGEFAKQMGAWGVKKFMGKSFEGVRRNTYLVSPTGEVVKKWEDVNPAGHITDVVKEITRRIGIRDEEQ
ncbi:MAG: peroxiredoxin [Chthoniobacterales bacterium]|nr:peroxiredoxin [Chthoniobacterales bacterium]